MQETDIMAALRLFSGVIDDDSLPYKKLSEDEFRRQFILGDGDTDKYNVVRKNDNGTIIGFANASYKKGTGAGFITFVAVDKEYRGNGLGASMLSELERALTNEHDVKTVQVSFFNPINLVWIVPGTDNHEHPNSPGIDSSSGAHAFFGKSSYKDITTQNSYHRLLDGFDLPDDVKQRLDSLREKNLEIVYFDKNKNFGVDELIDDLATPLWSEVLRSNTSDEGGLPLLILSDNGKTVGFTGPLKVEESGRGYFAGIGIHSAYRSVGAGKALFFVLCNELRKMGAEYMTLFTGSENPARHIYEKAGFKIVKSWNTLKKDMTPPDGN